MMFSRTTEFMELHEFRAALALARPGTAVVYARGHVAQAKAPADHSSPAQIAAAIEMRATAGFAWSEYETRRVCLTQKRIAENCWEYRATKRAPKTESNAPLVAVPLLGAVS